MGKYKEKPKYNIISMRITDEDFKALAVKSQKTNRSISDLMREALRNIVLPTASC